jgi:SAM-dependent methyltransferase
MRFALPEDHPLTDAYDVVACNACGFVYANTVSTQADYDRYYADLSKYSDATTGTGTGREPWDRARLRDTATFVADALDDPSARVVDIGCANGGLLHELHELGLKNLDGVDPSPACVTALETMGGVRGHVGGLFKLPTSVHGADCVILSHVLEHVRDLGQALARVSDVLEPGGRVYAEVPDATRYAEMFTAPFQDFNVEHINHFSVTSLSNALARAGFVVEQVQQKAIAASATALVPALGIMARRDAVTTSAIAFDRDIGPAMNDYVNRSRQALGVLQRYLDRELTGTPEIIIWGTGQTTLTLLSSVHLDARVVALTDSSSRYHGRRLGGIPVIPPDDLAGFTVPILIGSLISHQAIENRIRELQLPNRTIRLAADRLHSHDHPCDSPTT